MLPSLSLGQSSLQYPSGIPSQVLITANNLKEKGRQLSYSFLALNTFCANHQFLNSRNPHHCVWVTGDCRSIVSQVREPSLNQQDQVLVKNGWNKHIITEMVLSYFKGQLRSRNISLFKLFNAYLMTAYRHQQVPFKTQLCCEPWGLTPSTLCEDTTCLETNHAN